MTNASSNSYAGLAKVTHNCEAKMAETDTCMNMYSANIYLHIFLSTDIILPFLENCQALGPIWASLLRQNIETPKDMTMTTGTQLTKGQISVSFPIGTVIFRRLFQIPCLKLQQVRA